MLRLSKLTDYAVVVLVRLAETEGVQTSPGIAAATGIPEPTVAKVLKTLSSGGLVTSQRGARGGYRLLRPLTQIPVADVIAAVDGPIALAACVDGSAVECEITGAVPGTRALGSGERRDPSGAVHHHPGRHAGNHATSRLPRAPPLCCVAACRIGRSYACSHRNARHRPIRYPVRLQMGLGDDDRDGPRAERAERGHHPSDLLPQGGAFLDAGLAPEGVCGLEDDGGAEVGEGASPADRLPGPPLLRRPEEEAGAEVAGRGRSRTARHL